MNISILGSTGSIGTQALEVVDCIGGIEVEAISGNKNIALLEQQIRKYHPKIACVQDEKSAEKLKISVSDTNTKIVSTQEGLVEIATLPSVNMVLSAIVGFAGLIPTYRAIKAGKDIALANKETLVAAGDIIINEVKSQGVRLLPVDSEHSAVFQCIQGNENNKIEKILLTASGGPFFGKTKKELKNVTKEQALCHPCWNMGAKITIDSATLMNKGLEIIEARWLFDTQIDDIEVVVHPQSIIHSMVQYCDGSVVAQMSPPSMKLPIQYAFTYPDRVSSLNARLDFKTLSNLSFSQADEDTFRCLNLAKIASKAGGIMPTVLNAANEIAVEKFLCGQIEFLHIADIIEDTMDKYSNIKNPDIDEIIETDKEIRRRLSVSR